MNIPIMVRSNELRQLRNWVPEVCGAAQRAGLDDEAEQLQHIHEDVLAYPESLSEDPPWVSYVAMDKDDWATLVMGLERVKDEEGEARVWYVQKKLSNRIESRLRELEDDD